MMARLVHPANHRDEALEESVVVAAANRAGRAEEVGPASLGLESIEAGVESDLECHGGTGGEGAVAFVPAVGRVPLWRGDFGGPVWSAQVSEGTDL